MNKLSLLLIALLIITGNVYAQVLPKEGSKLNYRLIGFSPFPDLPHENYAIQVAGGDVSSDIAFKKNIIKTVACKTSRAVIEVPSFGKHYTWRVVTFKGHAIKSLSKLYHFETAEINGLDSSSLRIRVTKPSAKYGNAYVLLDGNKAMYDMQGKLVWYLPGNQDNENVRDLKVSPQGTFTFLSNDNAIEMNYDGTVRWKGPNDGKVSGTNKEQYHDAFTRLGNGHYMVLGNETVPVKSSSSAAGMQQVPFGTVIEYDEYGKVMWSWKASDYFQSSDLAGYVRENGISTTGLPHMNENAFFFDEKEQVLYVSFQNISRIVKIKYPEGTVLNEYGEKYKSGAPVRNGLYCNQHACKRSAVGCLFLFNTNGCNPGGLPKIKKLTEPVNKNEPLKKVWEYTCSVDRGVPARFPIEGSVSELADQSLFVCMGTGYSKLFIVDSNKEVLWSALPEQWSAAEHKWVSAPQYGASIISDPAQIEQLVFNAEKPR